MALEKISAISPKTKEEYMDFIKNLVELLQKTIPPIHKEGHPFIFIFAAVFLVAVLVSSALGWICAIATIWCVYFFRDPERVTPVKEGLVISPADGFIQKIEQVAAPEELGLGDTKLTRISIFLNVFNVHVNRVPVSGEISELNYRPGKFLSANLDKASEENERQIVVIKTEDGRQVVCVQIAGLVARRIVCDLAEGQKVEGGQRFGIIRFGSRADIYLPQGVNPLVVAGQTAIGGETILADLQGNADSAFGEIR
jgi:phosphatidylserine decarboxylase